MQRLARAPDPTTCFTVFECFAIATTKLNSVNSKEFRRGRRERLPPFPANFSALLAASVYKGYQCIVRAR